jgi:hypothetical protein
MATEDPFTYVHSFSMINVIGYVTRRQMKRMIIAAVVSSGVLVVFAIGFVLGNFAATPPRDIFVSDHCWDEPPEPPNRMVLPIS